MYGNSFTFPKFDLTQAMPFSCAVLILMRTATLASRAIKNRLEFLTRPWRVATRI
jgi:hypothetical protein